MLPPSKCIPRRSGSFSCILASYLLQHSSFSRSLQRFLSMFPTCSHMIMIMSTLTLSTHPQYLHTMNLMIFQICGWNSTLHKTLSERASRYEPMPGPKTMITDSRLDTLENSIFNFPLILCLCILLAVPPSLSEPFASSCSSILSSAFRPIFSLFFVCISNIEENGALAWSLSLT